MSTDLTWKPDEEGDALWRGEEFLGCIFNRDPCGAAGASRGHGWRVLSGEELVFIGDVLSTTHQPDARKGARALLEAHVGATLPLPTAQYLWETL